MSKGGSEIVSRLPKYAVAVSLCFVSDPWVPALRTSPVAVQVSKRSAGYGLPVHLCKTEEEC